MTTQNLTADDIAIVQRTWQQVAPIADTAAGLFYDRLFATDPDLRAMFSAVDLDMQKKRLMEALSFVIGALDNFDALVPTIAALGQRHVGYGVTPAHYFTVGSALLHTLEQGLGDQWTDTVAAAWTNTYTAIADIMKNLGSPALAA
jgi:hemoglobin-like flavoprotein